MGMINGGRLMGDD